MLFEHQQSVFRYRCLCDRLALVRNEGIKVCAVGIAIFIVSMIMLCFNDKSDARAVLFGGCAIALLSIRLLWKMNMLLSEINLVAARIEQTGETP